MKSVLLNIERECSLNSTYKYTFSHMYGCHMLGIADDGKLIYSNGPHQFPKIPTDQNCTKNIFVRMVNPD
jgi:hypothetical protein